MDKILGPTADEEDFGSGASIDGVFNVHNVGEWGGISMAGGSRGDEKNYVINILGDFPATSSPTLPTYAKVSIRGNHTITYTSSSVFLLVGMNQTLILRSPLIGNSTNNNALVTCNGAGSHLIMRDGASITGNNGTTSGSGVYGNNGTFTMYGGTISGNTSNSGSGVYFTGGTFTMYGGTISGNSGGYSGGGVYVGGGEFIKTGGIIYGNDAKGNSNTASDGHAAYNVNTVFPINYTLGPRVTGNIHW
jgi:hypothetical protein